MTDLINQLRYLSRVTKDYDQEHMTSADYEMIPIVTKHAADRIEELMKERDAALAERNKFQFYLQRTHADWELEVAAVDALNAKLAKAVEALQRIAEHPYCWHTLARAVLAELEGEE